MNRQEPGSIPGTRKEYARPLTGDGNGGSARYADESVPGLVKRLAMDLSTLFSQELALAKAEMKSAVADVQGGIASIAMGGAVLYAGLLFLLAGVTMLLTAWFTLIMATFIVGGVVAIIGAIMLSAGKKQMKAESLKPDRTIDSVKKDAEFARRKVQ